MKKNHVSEKAKRVVCIMAGLFVSLTVSLSGRAAESDNAVFGTLEVLTADTEVREAADADSAQVGFLEAGTPVIVKGGEGEWREILFQGTDGYIPAEALGAYVEDAQQLDAEMDKVEEEEQRFLQEHELYLRQKRISTLMGIIIAVLIVLIFCVGILSALRGPEGAESGSAKKRKKRGSGNKKRTGKRE